MKKNIVVINLLVFLFVPLASIRAEMDVFKLQSGIGEIIIHNKDDKSVVVTRPVAKNTEAVMFGSTGHTNFSFILWLDINGRVMSLKAVNGGSADYGVAGKYNKNELQNPTGILNGTTNDIVAVWEILSKKNKAFVIRKATRQNLITKAPTSNIPIGHLKTKDKFITIKNGKDGPLYTVKSKDGKVLAVDIPATELSSKFPELKDVVQRGIADWAGLDAPDITVAP